MILLKYLRDPIWQSLGTMIAVIAIFVSVSTTSIKPGELSVIRLNQAWLNAYLPSDKIKFLLEDKNIGQSLNEALIEYFIIINTDSHAILPSYFFSPLTISIGTDGNKILLVNSCHQPSQHDLEDFMHNISSNISSNIEFQWKMELEEKWIAEPSLINPSEASCLFVITKLKQSNKEIDINNPYEAINFSSRIAGINLKFYSSPYDFYINGPQPLEVYWNVGIFLFGKAILWFIFLQISLFTSIIVLAHQGMFLTYKNNKPYRLTILKLTILMLISTSTAEILTDIFINQDYWPSPVIWPLLATHLAIIGFLIKRSFHMRQSL